MPKSSRCRSTRRTPLSDVSNTRTATRSRRKEAVGVEGDGGTRGRLLLVSADLSKLCDQIDGLVKRVLDQKLVNEKEKREIECFLRTLSDMHSSLMSWVPRLQRALGSSTTESEKHFGSDSVDVSSSAAVKGGECAAPDDLSEPAQALVVSPSPLVSWRNGACAVESGRQLFLLTPLHKSKAAAPKFFGSPRSLVGKSNGSHCSLRVPTSSHLANSARNVQAERTSTVHTQSKLLMSSSEVSGSTSTDTGFVSPKRTTNGRDQFLFCLTPCLKTPAVKPLLDSIPESFQEDIKDVCNGIAPWLNGVHKKDDICSVPNTTKSDHCSNNSSSDELSRTLASKYPELFGLREAALQRKEIEESLHWFLSPPKTCVLMEPPDEKFLLASERNKKFMNSGLKIRSPDVAEATPMWKDFGTATGNGKKAGETTLKRELWTRFEAVSAHNLRFDPSIFKQEPRKQLIDLLEDVS